MFVFTDGDGDEKQNRTENCLLQRLKEYQMKFVDAIDSSSCARFVLIWLGCYICMYVGICKYICVVKLQPTFCLACSFLLIFHFARFTDWGFSSWRLSSIERANNFVVDMCKLISTFEMCSYRYTHTHPHYHTLAKTHPTRAIRLYYTHRNSVSLAIYMEINTNIFTITKRK